ncbi:uncharacterized protein KY384_001932 [Bacidia gigantensis]|uniref:uncharacterized protein n=1 Tax=Bacidia gigantensis TaxID=2732470 RepID=UPI001D03CC1F|nr:uncharacterized protein KY384_001932 [Bacidia gigantensis]KAG8533149.1 hypothetical protein KY384_001932 [Bacidia gigantensis]
MNSNYSQRIDEIRETEFPSLKGTVYLDHAGTTLYPKSLIESFSMDMTSNLFGNPHSASGSSQRSTQRIDDVRLRALKFFKADPDQFDIVFVANATAGIKLVAEAFREHEKGFWYGYHSDSHTSLVGVREVARAGHQCFGSDHEVEKWLQSLDAEDARGKREGPHLFAYPAQSNMNGRRLPLSWCRDLRLSKDCQDVYSLLDAAALVSTSPLDFSDVSYTPDFTVISFYKIFGFPDLGALIVRKAAAGPLLRRHYFGGGTVEMVSCGNESWHIKKQGSLHDQLEDGTLPIHSLIGLDHAFDVHQKLYGSLEQVGFHTACLAHTLHCSLSSLRHYNDAKVCELYTEPNTSYEDDKKQGPIIAFNVKDSRGEYVSNTEIEKLAIIKNIHFRCGGLCNPGGIASSLGLVPWELKRNFSGGQRCGSENDIIGGKPTGMIRVSLGAMSNVRDIEIFVCFLQDFFVDLRPKQEPIPRFYPCFKRFFVESLTVYPIKSCGGWAVPKDSFWDIRSEGLAWDREWCLIHQGTRRALSQKKHPRMALLRPQIDIENSLLRIEYYDPTKALEPSAIAVPLSEDPTVYDDADFNLPMSARVCEDNILMRTYASPAITEFLTTAIGIPCTLARFPPNSSGTSTRHSKIHLAKAGTLGRPKSILLSNESPILTISRSSLTRLNQHIKLSGGKPAQASVFRANIVLVEDPVTSSGEEQSYAEDSWQRLQIGNSVTLDVLGPCRRCQMVCIDQNTAEKNEEPFVTLARTRRQQGKVFFGIHTALAEHTSAMARRIKLGDMAIPG